MYSINYVKIKPGLSEVIKINNATCEAMNADFDGDELNILVTTSPQVNNGVKLLMTYD
jgi:DNA-directed RNA polymerase beta' subunit